MRLLPLILAFLFCFIQTNITAQGRGFKRISVPASTNAFLRAEGYELDHGSTKSVSYVYADRKLLRKLQQKGISYQLKPEHIQPVRMISQAHWALQKSSDCSVPLNGYPTYELYEQLMSDFAQAYPSLTRLHQLGTLPSGRKIIALEITDNPDLEEEEPKVLYTSSMHGDELGGYHVTLRLISYLLCNYGNDQELTDLVNSTELWINPLANPDGAYYAGNASVNSAIRWNAAGIDLNRNYPDPNQGPNPDGEVYQPETLIFMELAENVHFDLALNFHGGAEVFNYPWDTYSERHADDAWWQFVGREFADACQHHSHSNQFFRDLDDGITNGYDWYPVAGGRQDFMNFDHRTREATLEISSTKLVPETQFEELWASTQEALIKFIQQAQFGVRGIVSDSITGAPLRASITIPEHDLRNSDIFSILPTGRYHRYLKGGEYDIQFSAEGYIPKTITVTVTDRTVNVQDVKLVPETFTSVYESSLLRANIMAHYEAGKLQLMNLPVLGSDKWQFRIYSSDGRALWSNQVMQLQSRYIFDVNNLPNGMYYCEVSGDGGQQTVKFLVAKKKKR